MEKSDRDQGLKTLILEKEQKVQAQAGLQGKRQVFCSISQGTFANCTALMDWM